MTTELLLEIGTEEIPAGYLENGLAELKRLTEKCLKDNRVTCSGSLVTRGTPRRLVLMGKGISETQSDLIQEVTGPPKNVAYDESGAPTKAALGFAKKQGVDVSALGTIETPRGEYLHVKKKVFGKPTREILSASMPGIMGGIPWPKSMRWATVGFGFARPVHWILCLFGGAVVPFEAAGVNSGNQTRGHRFMAPGTISISNIDAYEAAMASARVVVDPENRRKQVTEAVARAAATAGGVPGDDPELLDTVTNLVEYPTAVCGSFDKAFLGLPDAVLITAMREHQKYFAVYDENGLLMANFVAVNNTLAKDESVVCRGHERVLRARLSDADFFLKEDRKRPLLERLEDLKKVIYQARLGTSCAKVMRVETLSGIISEAVLPEGIETAKQVARLAKCDLVTHMVTEFPSLQGVVGEAYAQLEGYDEVVSSAVYEHYLPLKAGGDLPQSDIGAVVGMADRLDTIAGCFAVGLEPTGKADPFALRRHALAIIRVMENKGWDLSFHQLVDDALSLLAKEIDFDLGPTRKKVLDFVRERYRNMMLGSDYGVDLVEAAMGETFDKILHLRAKISQLRDFRLSSRDFEPLALTFKRVNNIIKKQDQVFAVEPGLFSEDPEKVLWETYLGLKDDVSACIRENAFDKALEFMSKLRSPVDDLFDNVEVLTKDNALRKNRVGMLRQIAAFVRNIADFSRFSI